MQPQATSIDLGSASDADRKLTPMLRQYREAKAECPGALLLFRMGDFFELFFEDAVVASRELELTLTSRDKDSADPIPMAGVPHHAVTSYLARLVQRGYTVAICDQVEDPKLAKGLVRRAITRVVTPGTVSDLEALDPGAASYLGYVAPRADGTGFVLALLDLLAGELLCTHVDGEVLADECHRMGVRELLVESEGADAVRRALGEGEHAPLHVVDMSPPSDAQAVALLTEWLGRADVDGLPAGGSELERLAIARLLAFAESTQRRALTHIMPARAYRASDYVVLDEATRRNLELTATREGKQGSLLWHLDRCKTAVGTRLLTQWLLFPLRDSAAIEARLDNVGALKRERGLREALQHELNRVRDLERLVGRAGIGPAQS